jgi:hypothetical protein
VLDAADQRLRINVTAKRNHSLADVFGMVADPLKVVAAVLVRAKQPTTRF